MRSLTPVLCLATMLSACGDDGPSVQHDALVVDVASGPHYALDPTFGNGGVVIVDPGSAFGTAYELDRVTLDRAAGGGLGVTALLFDVGAPPWPLLVCRLTDQATPVSTFGGGCIRLAERVAAFPVGIAFDTDGLLFGREAGDIGSSTDVIRYGASGTRDTGYAQIGQLTLGPVEAMAVRTTHIVYEPTGAQVAVGSVKTASQLWAQRFVNGVAQTPVVIDSTPPAFFATTVRRTATELLIGGATDLTTRIVRTDLSLAKLGHLTESDCVIRSFDVLANGDLIVACTNPAALPSLRRFSNGTRVDGFGTGTTSTPLSVLGLPQSLLFVGGHRDPAATTPIAFLLSADTGQGSGTIDQPTLTGWMFRNVSDAELQVDGRFLVAGVATSGASARPYIARYVRVDN